MHQICILVSYTTAHIFPWITCRGHNLNQRNIHVNWFWGTHIWPWSSFLNKLTTTQNTPQTHKAPDPFLDIIATQNFTIWTDMHCYRLHWYSAVTALIVHRVSKQSCKTTLPEIMFCKLTSGSKSVANKWVLYTCDLLFKTNFEWFRTFFPTYFIWVLYTSFDHQGRGRSWALHKAARGIGAINKGWGESEALHKVFFFSPKFI